MVTTADGFHIILAAKAAKIQGDFNDSSNSKSFVNWMSLSFYSFQNTV